MLTKDIMKRARADAGLSYNEKVANLQSLRALKSEYKQIITQIEYFQENGNFEPNFIKMSEFFNKLNNVKIPDELKSEQDAVQTITELKELGKQCGEIFAQQKFSKMYQSEQFEAESEDAGNKTRKSWAKENIIAAVSMFLVLTIPVAVILAIRDRSLDKAKSEEILSYIDKDIVASLQAIDPSLDPAKITVGKSTKNISDKWTTLKTTIGKIKGVLDGDITPVKHAKQKRRS